MFKVVHSIQETLEKSANSGVVDNMKAYCLYCAHLRKPVYEKRSVSEPQVVNEYCV